MGLSEVRVLSEDATGDEAMPELPRLLERLSAGDEAARRLLVERALDRLRSFVRSALARSPRVRRWEQSDDIAQRSAMRLWAALEEVRPTSPRAFFGLCSEMTRRTMIDLVRKYYGPEGVGQYHDSPWRSGQHPALLAAETDVRDSNEIDLRLDAHAAIGKLPADLRAVVDLLFYQGLTISEAAGVLGVVERTVSRRRREAMIELSRRLGALDKISGSEGQP